MLNLVEVSSLNLAEVQKCTDTGFNLLSHLLSNEGPVCNEFHDQIEVTSSKVLKKKSDPPIVVGGPTATFSDKEIMNHTPEIDVCVRGEGEETVLELMKKGFDDFESVKGITLRSGNELLSTLQRPLISGGIKGAELDVKSSPYLTGIIPPDYSFSRRGSNQIGMVFSVVQTTANTILY